MPDPDCDVVVIGAGLTGLICAQGLAQAGLKVMVLEKARGVGGRVTRRRLASGSADHGLPYLSPTGGPVDTYLKQWQALGIVKPWLVQAWELRHAKGLQPLELDRPLSIAPTGMSAIAKTLSQQLDVRVQQRVTQLAIARDQTWQLTVECSGGSSPQTNHLTTRAIALAIPAPQALALVQTIPQAETLAPDLLHALAHVTYDPCFTVIAGYGAIAISKIKDPAWFITFPDDTALQWMGLDSSKREPEANPVCVLHSNANFAHQHLDHLDLSSIGELMLRQAAITLNAPLDSPSGHQIHRWRYARVQRGLQAPYARPTELASLVCGGDWCQTQPSRATELSTKVPDLLNFAAIDNALISGQQMAEHLKRSLIQID